MIDLILALLCVILMIGVPLFGIIVIAIDIINHFKCKEKRCKDCKILGKCSIFGVEPAQQKYVIVYECKHYRRKFWKIGRPK
jgi:hypothetical protein